MVELCAVCILLATFFMFMSEMALYIRDVIHIQQVAREGAREASLISSSPRFDNPIHMGQNTAEDYLKQYYGSTAGGDIQITRQSGSFYCQVDYQHHVFMVPAMSKTITGHAVYPDFSD